MNLSAEVFLEETRHAARQTGTELHALDARTPAAIERAFERAVSGGVTSMLVLDDPVLWSHRKQIVALAARHRLPVMYGYREFVDDGGLISYLGLTIPPAPAAAGGDHRMTGPDASLSSRATADVVTCDRVDHLSDRDRDAIRALTTVVYPPTESADWPGRQLEWAAHEWCVRVHTAEGVLVSYVGILVRDALHDGRPVCVGGIGGVKTHPAARRRGRAGRAIDRAIELFRERGVAFSVLVCAPRLIAYYSGLGWREFSGRLLVRQRGTTVDFTFNRVMTRAVAVAPPESGTIDLQGPPW